MADSLLLSSEDFYACCHPTVSLSPAGVLGQTFQFNSLVNVTGIDLKVSGIGQFNWQITNQIHEGTTTSNVLAQGTLAYPSSEQKLFWNPHIVFAPGTYYLILSEDTQNFNNVGYFQTGCLCYPTDIGSVNFGYIYGSNNGFPPSNFNLTFGNGPLSMNVYGTPITQSEAPELPTALLFGSGIFSSLLLAPKLPRYFREA
jgi:hypothetical protein